MKKKEGFSLIEVLVSLVLLTILTSMFLVLFNNSYKLYAIHTKETKIIKDMDSSIRTHTLINDVTKEDDTMRITFNAPGKVFSFKVAYESYSHPDTELKLSTFYIK